MTHHLQEYVPLAPLTTFTVGGPARFFIEAIKRGDVHTAYSFAREHALPLFVLGGGSNCVIADEGYAGVVLAMRIQGIEVEDLDSQVRVTAGAGVVFDDLVMCTIERGLAGLECLSGIPGTVGGAVVANVGAYRAELSDVFETAEVLDLTEKEYAVRTFTKDDCHFSYHDSIFSQTPSRYVVLGATFLFPKVHPKRLFYKDHRFDMATFATDNGREATLSDIRAKVLDVREEKGSLMMPGRLSFQCAGSIFHMPYVSPAAYEAIKARARELDATKEERLRPWAWEQSDGSYKLAPGFLLEYTAFHKGYVQGAVGISPRHILSIINVGGARARDISQLAHDMQKAVQKLFSIELEREVQYVGNVDATIAMSHE